MSAWQGPRRWDPFGELHREVGRLLQTFEPWGSMRWPGVFPLINVYELPDCYVLKAQLPGLGAEEIDLSLTGETLTLRGERRRPDGVSDEAYRRQERPFGRWSRSVSLPDRVDPQGVTAECVHGVLTVTLPKVADTRPRQINVRAPGAPPPAEAEETG
jgi:HSP20 family protein